MMMIDGDDEDNDPQMMMVTAIFSEIVGLSNGALQKMHFKSDVPKNA